MANQLLHQVYQVFSETVFRDLVFLPEVGENEFETAIFDDQLPDSGADLVEAEVVAAVEVEENRLALQAFEKNSIGDSNGGGQIDRRHTR